jgi:hypothetical protein
LSLPGVLLVRRAGERIRASRRDVTGLLERRRDPVVDDAGTEVRVGFVLRLIAMADEFVERRIWF